ncbi:hydrolase [Sphingobacterium detergens]|uniref:Nicotinamidase-related amidase n=1 Tax=Sphingobacterium detergens TaxID=1145106 RepID=A0A420BKY2_SPHD1|nr:hydrolase [Sphingobacterium detergens]RKE57312.1 nicotinamidase-related amidase [Sphingobacterium detergens]
MKNLLILFFFCLSLSATAQVANNNSKAGLQALLTPENSVLILIDHQPFQFAGLGSHNSQTIINNVVGLAKTAKAFGVPTLLTTVVEDLGGNLLKQLQDVFPEQKPLNRTWINAWEDPKVVDWVKKTGRKKVVIAALWSEICLAMPAIQAAGEGYDVYVVTDASGGTTLEAHEMAIHRMIQSGVTPITWGVFGGELQRDWARQKTVPAMNKIMVEHQGNVGTSWLWEQQLLNNTKQK